MATVLSVAWAWGLDFSGSRCISLRLLCECFMSLTVQKKRGRKGFKYFDFLNLLSQAFFFLSQHRWKEVRVEKKSMLEIKTAA